MIFGISSSRNKEAPVGEAEGLQSVPNDTLGLEVLYSPTTDPDVDIVAVHGLGGDARSTWTTDSHCWLKDSLPQALERKSKAARVMTFGYDASLFTKASKQRSFTFAENLLSALKDERDGPAAKRPLIFLGHSLGGIVIKKALVIAQTRPSQWGDLLTSVVHLCFFGTPHQGTASLSQVLLNLGNALTRSKEGSVLRELKLWSPALMEVNAMWVEIANGFTITSFIERETYNGLLVVPEGSARLNRDNETVVHMDGRNHINICKFADSNDRVFRMVFNRLHAVIATIGTAAQARDHEDRIDFLLKCNASRIEIEEREKVRQWLDPQATKPSFYREPGTNEWFLGDSLFDDWLAGKVRYLVLQGPVGCGKTTLLGSIAARCQEKTATGDEPTPSGLGSSSTAVVTFYFSSTTNRRLGVNELLRYLLTQLSLHSMPTALQRLYRQSTRSYPAQRPDDDEELTKVLKAILKERESGELGFVTKTYVLLDALDEIFPLSQCREVQALLESIAGLDLRNLHVLITTRPLKLPWGPLWAQHDIPLPQVAEDIETYVRHTVSQRLCDIAPESQQKIIGRLTGPSQTMFRYAYLQLQSFLDKDLRLLRVSDVDEMLQQLPRTLNETYDNILKRLESKFWPLVSSALRWIAFAHRPLSVYEVIDACIINQEAGKDADKFIKSERLRPAGLAALLHHLVVFERRGALSNNADYTPSGDDLVVLAHFSVKEYIMDTEYMSPDLLANFALHHNDAHLSIAGDCMAYLLVTNTFAHKCDFFPLRSYAWNHWALHTVSLTVINESQDSATIEQDAIRLSECVAFHDGDPASERLVVLQRCFNTIFQVFKPERPEGLLECLDHPCFFEESRYNNTVENLYLPLEPDHIRLLQIVPDRSYFSGIRCQMSTTPLHEATNFEFISHSWDEVKNAKERRHVWIDGVPIPVWRKTQDVLRNMRSLDLAPRTFWVEGLCLSPTNRAEWPEQMRLLPRLPRAASMISICLEECSNDEAWALELLTVTGRLVGARVRASQPIDSDVRQVRGIVRASPMITLDPYEPLLSLFGRAWYKHERALHEVGASQKTVIYYGNRPLATSQLWNFVDNIDQSIQLIDAATDDRKCDSSILTMSLEWERLVRILHYARLEPRDSDHFSLHDPPLGYRIQSRGGWTIEESPIQPEGT